MKLYLKILLTIISAAVTSLSFYTAGFMALFSLAPFFIALYYSQKLSERAAYGFLFGIVFFAGLTNWFTYYTFGLWIPILIFLSLHVLFFGMAFHFIVNIKWPYLQMVLTLAAWMAIEFFRCRTFLAFPWGMLAYSQYEYIPLVQITGVTGVYGLSAAIALFNLCVAYTVIFAIKERKIVYRFMALSLSVVLIIVIFGSINIYGYRQNSRREENRLNIALVQTNILFEEKFHEDPEVLIPSAYSQNNYFRPGTDIVVFAESVLWGDICNERNATFRDWAQLTASQENLHFLLGQIVWDEEDNHYNSALLYSPQFEILGRYNKIHPLPFAEYMPYPHVLGFLGFLNIASQNITPDKSFDLIYYPDKGFMGINICFESTLPIISRTLRNNCADIIFVLTDAAGFRDSIASWHHVIFSAFRAVENNSYVVHSSNKGVTAVINPLGEIILETELGLRDVFYQTVYFYEKKSIYSKIGNLCLYVFFASCLVCLIIYLLFRRQREL